jgi:lipoprotein-anchoring transpeptidase ErfK/SrfK
MIKRSSKTGASRRSWNVRRRLACVVCLACGVSAPTAVSAVAAGMPSHVRGTQALAELQFEHQAYSAPSTGAPHHSVPARTPITADKTTLPVIGHKQGRGRRRWLKVMLPGRPNGSTGWIEQGGTTQLSTPWHIFVSLPLRRVWVYLHGRLWRNFQAVVGKPSTPTPTGNFFVQETLIMPVSEPGGPFALALSARSDVFQEFDGGPGQIGIHGRDGLGGDLGQAESHGCMRLNTEAITWLAARIGPGVPVNIEG